MTIPTNQIQERIYRKDIELSSPKWKIKPEIMSYGKNTLKYCAKKARWKSENIKTVKTEVKPSKLGIKKVN